MAQFSVLLTEL